MPSPLFSAANRRPRALAGWRGLRARLGDRTGAIALTAAIELLLLLALLSLGTGIAGDGRPLGEILTSFDVPGTMAPQPVPPQQQAEAPAPAAPSEPVARAAPSLPHALPSPAPVALPRAPTTPAPAPPAAAPSSQAASPIRAVIRSDMAGNRGPADSGTPGDSQRIAGSGPNGEPLYAAKWYREPTDDEFKGYFSRVQGSGWALINCRTEPEFRVDGCVLVDQSDRSVGSAVLAMAWQFRVRPPRIGGRSMVGEWVRIRIDYTVTRS